jgi:hypothetical protein
MRRTLPLTLLALGVVTIFVLRWIVHIPGTPVVEKISFADAQEFRAFVIWAITFTGFIVTAVWASLVAGTIARQYLSTSAFSTSLILAGILTGLVGFASRLAWDDRNLLAIVERARLIPIRYVTMVGNSLAVGSATLVIAACIALASSGKTPSVPELRRRIAESRLLLFSAAVLLVVGVAEIDFVFQLPVAVERARLPHVEPKVLQHVTRSMTLTAGMLYTSALLILFVPVAVVHEKWIDEGWQASPASKHSDWLDATGLQRSIGTTTSQIIAAAAPLLAALGLSPS